MNYSKTILRILLPVIVVAICFLVAKKIVANKEEVPKRQALPSVALVEATRLKKSNYRIKVTSQGTVSARTETVLTAEVSGSVVALSPAFLEGGFFEKGDFLLHLDPRNYETDVTIAEADLARARQALSEERARAEQAELNWQRLGGDEKPTDLVLRRPQLESARAEVAAAEARLERRLIDLERTRIIAPYSGRVLTKNVDIGEFITAGSPIATVYAVDYAEIRLPLSAGELEFVDIPELYRGQSAGERAKGPVVTLTSSVGAKEYRWKGRVVRAEGAIDSKSRQLFVIAEVEDPYGKTRSGVPPLKVGQFVEAEIRGHLLKGVYVISRHALREGGEVLVVTGDRLERRGVTVVWKDKESAVITKGVEAGELVVTTPAVYLVAGTRVKAKVEGEEEPGSKEPQARPETQVEGKR